MTTDANTGSGTSNGTVFLMDTTMPTGTDDSTVSNLKWGKLNICTFFYCWDISGSSTQHYTYVVFLQGYFSYTIQKRLAQILAFTLPITSSFNPGFFVHYDGKHSWYVWTTFFRTYFYFEVYVFNVVIIVFSLHNEEKFLETKSFFSLL